MAGPLLGVLFATMLFLVSDFRTFAAVKTHPHVWKRRSLPLRIGGRDANYAEHMLELSGERSVKILREMLTVAESRKLLRLATSTETFSEEKFGNPMQSPCQVLADENWKQGDLADMVRPIIEERVLPYMKLALDCETLEISQVLVRHYDKIGQQSFSAHTDHMAFGTAVVDLTPKAGSGLFVLSGTAREKSQEESGFFVPLGSGDVLVHKWNVWHGVALKEDHQRVSLIVWAQPAKDKDSGICSWYLETALAGDAEAAYHLGIEAWRQRLLGLTKKKLLQHIAGSEPLAALRRLGGRRAAEAWYQRCVEAMGSPKLMTELTEAAEAQQRGDLLKDLGRGLTGRGQRSEMRKALRDGWDVAQQELPESALEQKRSDLLTWSSGDLEAKTSDLSQALWIFEHAGLAIFSDASDQLRRAALEECQQEFEEYFSKISDVLPDKLKMKGKGPPGCHDMKQLEEVAFRFNEICSRSPGRFDVQLSNSETWALEEMPWKSLVSSILGDGVKEREQTGMYIFW